jgi:hypothetical protein
VVFVPAGRKARGCRLSRLATAAARSCRLRSLVFVFPSLHSHKLSHVSLDSPRAENTSSRPGATNEGTNTHYLFKPSPRQHFQAQSEHARSLQRDGVLPPTRAACRLPVSRPGQKALSALPTLLSFSFSCINFHRLLFLSFIATHFDFYDHARTLLIDTIRKRSGATDLD